MKDIFKWFLFYIAAAVVLLAVIGIGILLLSTQSHEDGPVVDIHEPLFGREVPVGEVVAVRTTARDDMSAITRIELWLTDGEHTRLIQSDKPLEDVNNFSVVQGWQPLTEGVYRLIVRATNEDDVSSQAFTEVTVLEESVEGESMISLPYENLVPSVPGGMPLVEEAVSGGTEGEQGGAYEEPVLIDLPQWNTGDYLADQITSGAVELLMSPLASPPIPLEFGAVDLEIGEEYDSVYCYGSLADEAPERIPETGSLETMGSRHWDIAAELSGQNTAIVHVQNEEPLNICVECFGNRGDNSYRIGTLDTYIPSDKWNGWLRSEEGTDGKGGFNLQFYIKRVTTPFPAPYDLNVEPWGERRYFSWRWDGNPEDIEGFYILRNGLYVTEVPPERHIHQMDPYWLLPPCGEEYEYVVMAKRGGCGDAEISAPSNLYRFYGSVCDTEKNDILRFAAVPSCNNAGIRAFIRYLYQVPSGPVYIGLRAFQYGNMQSEIWSSYAQIEHGEGGVQLAMTNQARYGLNSDRIDVFLFDEEGHAFYVESFEKEIHWEGAIPDLVINSARVDYDTNELVIEVRNRGCGMAENPELEVESVFGKVLHGELENLGGRKTIEWRYLLFPDEPALWGEGFTVTVNPDRDCLESEYYNNTFTVGPSQVDYVHIYKIDIHDDHDGWPRGPGELEFGFSALTGQDGSVTRDHFLRRGWQWSKGMHEVNVRLYPCLEDSEDLVLRVYLWEDDAAELGSPDDGGNVSVTHNHDGTLEGSWKGGGEFSSTSDEGDYTIYYRIVMAE